MQEETVDVVIVTYNSSEYILDCIESIVSKDLAINIIIIDNESRDNTYEVVGNYAKARPNITALRSGGNLGLAAGNNLALSHLVGDFTLIFNPDCRLRSDSIDLMLAKMRAEPDIVALGPKNVYPDGRPHSSYHFAWSYRHILLWRVLPYRIVRTLYDRLRSYREADVDFVSGACLMIRTEIFKRIDGYDPEYFLTVEDVCDLCRRARKDGGRVVFYPGAEVVHIGGRSGETVPFITTNASTLGTLYHFSKYHGRTGALVAYLLLLLGLGINYAMARVKALLRPRGSSSQNARIYARVMERLRRLGPYYYFHAPSIAGLGRTTRSSKEILDHV